MKFSPSIVMAILASASATPFSPIKKITSHRDLQQYSANGYYRYSSNGGGQNYGNYYNQNYDAQYVEDINEEDGNFQYEDADGVYDESFSSAGYFDDEGKFYYSEESFNGQYNSTTGQQYIQQWTNVGGVYGFFNAFGNWVKNTQSTTSLPCDEFDRQEVTQYNANGGTATYEAEDYQQGQQNGQNLVAYDDQIVYGEDDVDCQDQTRIRVANCERSVVKVTKVNILCDSPYRGTYYTTSSNHMASPLCEYGDEAVVMVNFDVSEDLDYMKTMYMTLGIYAGKKTKELLWAIRATELCNTFVGHQCTRAGSYGFAFRVSLDYGMMSDRAMFVPMVEMGFSTQADEGYNLGGVNINCRFNALYQQLDPWYNGKSAHASQQWGAGGFGKIAARFGWLIGLVLIGAAAALHVYARKQNNIQFQGNDDELVKDWEKIDETEKHEL